MTGSSRWPTLGGSRTPSPSPRRSSKSPAPATRTSSTSAAPRSWIRSPRSWTEPSPKRLFAPNGVDKRAQAVDLHFDDVSGLEPNRRLASLSHARRCAREEDVARLEREDLRDVRDQLVHGEDQLARARVLHRLPIEPQ